MINIFNQFKSVFANIIQEIAQENQVEINKKDLKGLTVEPAKDQKHGDLACNIAMIMVKKFNQTPLNNPRKLAEAIISKINDKNIKKCEIAGPGFINIFLNHDILYQIIQNLVEKDDYKFPNLGKNAKINLEYASPNPTGPIHVGHTRGAIYGDVLANLLQKVGFDVLKEYYINDAGSQIITLLKSSYLRYLESLGEKIEIPQGLYPGDYLIEIGQKLKEKFGETLKNKTEEEYLELIRDIVVDGMVELIKRDLSALGIEHNSYFSEKKNLHDPNKVNEILDQLQKQDLVYEGKLEAPKTKKGVGALSEDHNKEVQTLFRSSKFGDDSDRVVKKSDGTPTYFAADIAYSLTKFQRGAKTFIMPLGYDHAGYVKRLNAAVDAITNGEAKLKIILCQLVKFVKNGEPLKMSKRSGNFITAREVIDEVGADALRFIMLTRKNDAPFDFDLNKVIEQSKDNPIFYVQYAHARCCSILRNLSEANIKIPKNINFDILSKLTDESEINVIKKIANFERIIEMSANNFEPHRLAFYLQELAGEFHALWNKGTENVNLKFIIKEDLQITLARIYLILSVKKIIKTGLEIFNIKAVEEMR